MKIHLFFNRMQQPENFPVSVLKLQDILDRRQTPQDESTVVFSFEDSLPYKLKRKTFSADIYRLNVFAQYYEQLTDAKKAVFSAVVDSMEINDFEDIFLLTYGLDAVPVIKAETLEEVGQFCIDHEMLPELEHCPEEILPYLDRKEIGKTRMLRYSGILQNGFYCEPEQYQKPDITVEIQKPEKEFFRVLIGMNTEDRKFSQWVSLPTYYETIAEIGDCCGMDTSEMKCLALESSLPNFTKEILNDMEKIHDLNALAGWLADFDRIDFIKFKAVMQTENICTLDGAKALLDRIDEYEFDFVSDANSFGMKYLTENLPENFDKHTFFGTDLTAFGKAILCHKSAVMTDYGVVMHGHGLYEKIVSEELDEDLNEEISWGGM